MGAFYFMGLTGRHYRSKQYVPYDPKPAHRNLPERTAPRNPLPSNITEVFKDSGAPVKKD